MTMTSWITIVNKAAGGGRTGRDWPVIEKLLQQHNIRYLPFFTDRRLHASIIARTKIKEGYSRIIVVGGDGTMNEVINGLFSQGRIRTSDVMLGMIPVGTGNDWARMFNIPWGYEEAVLTIKKQHTFVQDAGLVHYSRNGTGWKRYFINIAGMGFDARVTERSNKLKEKGKGGVMLYFYTLLTSLIRYRSLKAEIDIDGRKMDRSIFSMNVGICKYSGGGMMQVPHAVADDGLYSITLIRKMGKLNVLANVKRLYRGTIGEHSRVETYTGQSVQVAGTTQLKLETDGESLGHGPLRFQIIPRSVTVIAGEMSA